jgi:hypothetical protein
MAARIASAASQLESFGDNVSGAKSEAFAELGKRVCRVFTSIYLLLMYACCQQAWAKAKSKGPRKETRLLCCSALSSASHYTVFPSLASLRDSIIHFGMKHFCTIMLLPEGLTTTTIAVHLPLLSMNQFY